MINEFSVVVLLHDFPSSGLQAGDVGTVVHVYGDQEGYDVDFVTDDGGAIDVLTLLPGDVELIGDRASIARRTGNTTIPHVQLKSVA